ncbi:MAG: hypothetical protein BWZ04_03068 [Firmicutes bacterium ADurb.BinA205]|nr:MAG: hypothetical protein BWZ04_03068 [Firmicutes bacterium ADurb.BinA205]
MSSFSGRRATVGTLAGALVIAALAGCQNNDELKQQRIEKADKHFEAIGKRVIPQNTTLSLS